MNFNFNDNLFSGIDDDLEKEIMGLRPKKKQGQNASGGTSERNRDSNLEDQFDLGEFQKELEKLNINMSDLELLDKNDQMLAKMMMEASQGKHGYGMSQNQVIEEEDESDSQNSSKLIK